MAITEPPGSVMDGLGNGLRERRLGPGSTYWWNRFRRRAVKESLREDPDEMKANLNHRGLNLKAPEPSSPVRIEMTLNNYNSSTSHSHSPKIPNHQDSRFSNTGISTGQDANPIHNESGRRTPHHYQSSENLSSSNQPSTSNLSFHPQSSNIKRPRPVSFTPIDLNPNGSPFESNFSFGGGASSSSSNQKIDEISNSDDFFPLAKMCLKCPKVPLFKALSSLPPELRSVEREMRTKGKSSSSKSNHSNSNVGGGKKKNKKKKGKRKQKEEMREINQSEGSETDLARRSSLQIQNIEESLVQDESLETEDEEEPFGKSGNSVADLSISELDEELDEGESEVRNWLGEVEAEKEVPRPKPERTHHCSVCKTCVLKFVSLLFALLDLAISSGSLVALALLFSSLTFD